jgi:hypothetical protein
MRIPQSPAALLAALIAALMILTVDTVRASDPSKHAPTAAKTLAHPAVSARTSPETPAPLAASAPTTTELPAPPAASVPAPDSNFGVYTGIEN